MGMWGVIVNTLTVLLGSSVGLILKKGIPEKVSSAAMAAIGLCTLYIGIDGALEGTNPIILIAAMVSGTILGTLLDLDSLINRLGSFVERKLKREGKVSVAQGFVSASLLFCVGAMTIVGSLNAGLTGDNQLLYTKSILDLISSCMLASTLGIGVLFAAAFVLVFQGGLVLCAGLLQNVLTDPALIAEITCCGSILIVGLGLNLLGITKLKIANFLPAVVMVVPVFYLVSLLPLG